MKQLITLIAVLFSATCFGQSVGIGTLTPAPSAQLDVSSTTKGMLIPRMSLNQRNLIPSPEPGLMIYQNDNTPGIYTWNGTAWVAVSNGAANLTLPFSGLYSGASTAFNIDLLGNTNNTGLKVTTYNSGTSKAISGEARGNGSTAGYFNVAGSPTNATALRTDDGDVLLTTNTGNVGIGSTATPTSQLMITTPSNSYGVTHTDGTVSVGTFISGAAGWLGTRTNHPLYMFTNNSGVQATLNTNGLFGIGNNNPQNAGLVVNKNVGATYGIFGGNTSGISFQGNFPGIGFNEYYNGSSKFIGTGYSGKFIINTNTGDLNWFASGASGVADGTASLNQRFGLSREGSMFLQGVDNGYIFTDRASTNYGGWNLYANAGKASLYRYTLGGNTITIDSVGSLGLQGVTTMTAPLTLNNSIGNKIDFYYSSPTSRYGIGLQGNLLQMYSDAATSDIAFGYGASSGTNFKENARFFGNGNMHLGKYSAWAGAADNRKINFGDGDYIYIGEVGADDRLEMQASAFSFKNGDVFIGTSDFTKAAGYKLRVGGKIISEEVLVQLNASWPDYVFAPNYKLSSLKDVKKYIKQNNHLPNIPSAKEIEKDGISLGEMQRKMMEKIEELTLHLIQQQEKIEALEKVIAAKN
jgi:hypothetical protein